MRYSRRLTTRLFRSVCIRLGVIPQEEINSRMPTRQIKPMFLSNQRKICNVTRALKRLIAVFIRRRTIKGSDLVEGAIRRRYDSNIRHRRPATYLIRPFNSRVNEVCLITVRRFLVLRQVICLYVERNAKVRPGIGRIHFTFRQLTIFEGGSSVIRMEAIRICLIVVLFNVCAQLRTLLLMEVKLRRTNDCKFLCFIMGFFCELSALFLTVILYAPSKRQDAPMT